uniref:Uncharacterized protein n=1 Tax=Myoviridae sp. ctMnh10 TaxID=2827682 RepID=A0A8S5THG0_9CAUD|nr:MAG TPA: hypothetical protein [Myoviridae sp. ctMnh10]
MCREEGIVKNTVDKLCLFVKLSTVIHKNPAYLCA